MNPLQITADDRELLEYLRMMAQMERLNGAARRFGLRYDGIGSFLLQHGAVWPSQPLPRGYPKMPLRQCFVNTMRLVMRRPHLRFCEGYALSAIPVHHAWAIDPDGRVIDPTWATATEKFGLTGRAYFGVVVPIRVVKETVLRTDTASIFYGDVRKIFDSIAEFENELLNCQSYTKGGERHGEETERRSGTARARNQSRGGTRSAGSR